ncbi:MAG: hypothetical protein SFY69_06695 [Planctomycetota bacterium]|nr:hypothetical protein [Planctomycetota bacterium]
MDAQLKAAAEAVKAHIKKWEDVATKHYKAYGGKDPSELAALSTLDADLEEMRDVVAELSRVGKAILPVQMAAGVYSGTTGVISTYKTQLSTMEKLVKEAKELQKAKPPAPPPKPAPATKPPVAPAKPAGAKANPNAGRPLPKPPARKPPPGYKA